MHSHEISRATKIDYINYLSEQGSALISVKGSEISLFHFRKPM